MDVPLKSRWDYLNNNKKNKKNRIHSIVFFCTNAVHIIFEIFAKKDLIELKVFACIAIISALWIKPLPFRDSIPPTLQAVCITEDEPSGQSYTEIITG